MSMIMPSTGDYSAAKASRWLSSEMQAEVRDTERVREIETEIDGLAAELWGLTEEELGGIRKVWRSRDNCSLTR